MNDFNYIIESDPDENSINFIKDELNKYNQMFAEPDNHKLLAVFIKDTDNKIIGGLLGETYWGWFYIDRFWINEKYRRQGLGSKILKSAEEEALIRGCKYSHLDTHDFQTVDFYKKNGYEIVSELKDLPKGHSKFLMKKCLE